MTRKYDTALRPYMQRRLEQIGEADIVVGIPCFNVETTIGHVLRTVSQGLHEHFADRRAVIVVSDGGSTDDTREIAKTYEPRSGQEKIVSIYRGIGGKGTALRAIFEAADRLQAEACAVVDSDLRSISTAWVRALLRPVLAEGYEYVAPVYTRYKYDGTITNNIVYNLTRALYGVRIRQPIGGDFAFSGGLARHYLQQDVWGSDIARFGIDIWMTTNAIVEGARIAQAQLGLKVHDAKDPAEALGPMFRQVCGTVFRLMEENEAHWLPVRGSEPVPTLGEPSDEEPEPIEVDQPRMVRVFREGYREFAPIWREIFTPETYAAIERAAAQEPDDLELRSDTWVRLLYELAAKYHGMTLYRDRMMHLMTPLYLARVAAFIVRTREMSGVEAERVVEEQAEAFEEQKDYLVERWQQEPSSALEDALSRR